MRKFSEEFDDMCTAHDVSDCEATVMLRICSLFYELARMRIGRASAAIGITTALTSIRVFLKGIAK